ncbi:hypothetical protein J3L18_05360 [Mucilaginibacter gossypii]|uniref:hypothetical protein n=1 Tax=Mucilaginibacter gossypii TaxID=551996 RepID=UPI000DCE49A9|nr:MULTISPECIES: hypothetical protein [Mucilaginibacter]QTE38506.1 hypothetical protein J3L18_05360 [Mucilaginibacter gossypii]RAV55757.1 hypothetical protein DIU36_16835 [Mucilaginibacter rubeus]
MDAPKFELNPEVAKNYNVVDGCPPVFENPVHGTIDIRTVSTSTVDALIKAGNNKFSVKALVAAKGKADAAA